MRKTEKKKLAKEWKEILNNHPAFARVFLAQQAILIDASELGYQVIDRYMCDLLHAGLPVLFQEFWASRCKKVNLIRPIHTTITCLIESMKKHRDPARCFGTNDDGWFDDPRDYRRIGKPPIPPLK